MAVPLVVQRLYKQYPNDNKEWFIKANEADVNALESFLRIKVPQEYREWIEFMDNIVAGAGYLHSLKKNPPMKHSLFDIYDDYPQWAKNKWIPVADDGLGNDFVMLVEHAAGVNPIVLFYNSIDLEIPSCVVNSNLFVFLECFFEDGLVKAENSWWCRNEAELLAKDPALTQINGLRFPWEPEKGSQ
jgi:SMI1 / KNR4 family (SUKH-1)